MTKQKPSIEISARTVAEAVDLALAQLGRDRDEVAIEILINGTDDEEALVRVSVVDDEPQEVAEPASHEDMAKRARHVLEEMLERMGIEGFVTAVRTKAPAQDGGVEETITLHVEGADEEAMGLLIGRRGDTLRSLQFMINLLAGRSSRKWPQIVVDVGNYRQRRQEMLESMARRMAERVRQSGKPHPFEPMSGADRRYIHLALREDPTVYTESEGEGEQRKIVIYPAKAAS
jgi:spoIIIJ-associated protein